MINERQSKILSFLNTHGEAKTAQLLALCDDCSSMTVWRDLEKLEKDGFLVRVRGGAILSGGGENGQEANFTSRAKQNIGAKEEIAKLATHLISTNRAYYFDAGSTIYTLVRSLPEGHYTVVTSAANTASELSRHSGSNITLLGGQMNGSTLSCSGPQAEQMLSSMNIDIAVMATSGYSSSGGFTSGCLTEAQLKRQVIGKAAVTIMLMDHGKIGKSHPFTFATLSDVDVLVSDSQLTEDFVNYVETQGVRVFSPKDGLSRVERDGICRELFASKL